MREAKAYEDDKVPLESNDLAIHSQFDTRAAAWPLIASASAGWWRRYAVLDSVAVVAASLAAEALRSGTLGNSSADGGHVSYRPGSPRPSLPGRSLE